MARRWITDDDVLGLLRTSPMESEALLADPLRQTRDRGGPVKPRVWVAVEGPNAPAWVEPTAHSLVELLELEPNWDSYGALAVDPWRVNAMLEVLALVMRDDTPVPTVCPTSKGGVQVEWHERGIDLEMETLSTHILRVSFEDSASGTEWDREVSADLSLPMKCVALLSSR